jgi:murein DD-endopeptidase MepM/ murein hydrolase activator NlpD
VALTNATVTLAGPNGGFGLCVILDRGDGISMLFGHLSRITVSAGEHVAPGQEIGAVGSTGVSTGVHLHYEYRRHGVDIDPVPFLTDEAPHGVPATVREALNLRQHPGLDAPILTVMPAGAAISVGQDGWLPVRWNERQGWAFGEYIDFDVRRR